VETLERASADILSDGETSVAEPESGSAVDSITFDRSGLFGELEVREYDDTPSDVTEPPVDAISTVEVVVPTEYDDESARIRFDLAAVENPSVDVDSVETESITVWRHVDGEWQALDTAVEDGQDGPVVVADTPGFSVFVISTDEAPTEEPDDDTDETPDDDPADEPPADESEETAGDDESTEADGDEEPAPDDAETDEGVPGFGPIVALIALLAAALIARRRE
jgi:PGF-CTERM protein/PGF-pre-PGF domain-containing protein